MGALKTCPRLYYYTIVLGWTPREQSVHLTFGLHYHAALEAYDHAKARGQSHEEATLAALRHALTISWNPALRRPWASDDKYKNRYTLIRTVLWYLDQFSSDPFETVRLASGKPAVELSFRMGLDYTTSSGEAYTLCGHLDRLATLDGVPKILDRKTTKSQLYPEYFLKYTPDNQFSTYFFAAQTIYHIPVTELVVDAAQIAIGFSRFARGLVQRTPAQLEEWYHDLGYWLRTAEGYAAAGSWPMNDKACDNYGGCSFRSICSKSPETREQWLEASFSRRIWDPLQVRGDI